MTLQIFTAPPYAAFGFILYLVLVYCSVYFGCDVWLCFMITIKTVSILRSNSWFKTTVSWYNVCIKNLYKWLFFFMQFKKKLVVKNSQGVNQSNHPLHILKEITRCSLRTGNILQHCTGIKSNHIAFMSNDFRNYF